MARMNIYEFMTDCQDQGLSPDEAERQWIEYVWTTEQDLRNDYYNDPIAQAGWAQQDLIDLRMIER